jgi:hypothetical protein
LGTRTLDDPVYQVVLEGRSVGPYDRRTIVGMRIKKALTSEHELLASDGARLTVADLLRSRPRDNGFQPNRSGTYSLVQANYSAALVDVQGPGPTVPRFQGEVEARVQTDVLRIAGRYRKGLGWREDRIKLPLKTIVHARVRNSTVDLWMKVDGQAKLMRLTLELFSPEAAGEFVDWLPGATPWPEADSRPAPLARPQPLNPLLWVAVAGTAVAVGGILIYVLSRPV